MIIRQKCGFLDHGPPYSTNRVNRVIFPDLQVEPAELPQRVIEMVQVRGRRQRVLFYNQDADPGTRRVGIAHGMGHLMSDLRGRTGSRECNRGLHELERDLVGMGKWSESPNERFCDLWAGEILAPFDVLDGYAPANLNPRDEDERRVFLAEVHRVGSRFNVSDEFMLWRLHDLALLRQSHFFVG